MSRLLPLLMLVFLTGCPAQKTWRTGQELDASGQDWAAAAHYIDALNQNPNFQKARISLIQVAHDAYAIQLANAQGLESRKDWPGALKAYQSLQTFVARAEREGSEPLSTIDLPGKIDEMQNSAAQEQYLIAEAAYKARSWNAAITAYKSALSFKSGYKDAQAKIGLSWYGNGEDQQAAKQYRAAATSFVTAGATKDAALRAAALYGALGKYMLDKGYCRQAVRDLREAQSRSVDSTIAKNLSTAASCAVTPVAVLPFENPTGTPAVSGVAVADSLSDEILLNLQNSSSEFVQLLERSAVANLLLEQGISSTKASSVSKLKGVRYLVLGKLTQVLWIEPPDKVTRRSTTGVERFACSNTDNNGQTITTTCERPIPVSYLEHHLEVSVHLAGTVRVVDAVSGLQLVTYPLDASASDQTSWADSFASAAGQMGSSIDIDPSLQSLASQRQTVADSGEMAKTLVSQLAKTASTVVLQIVDAEPNWQDPTSLTVSTLKQ